MACRGAPWPFISFAVFLLLIPATLTARPIPGEDAELQPLSRRSPERSWATGPVWYLMTSEEYLRYRRLPREEDRRAFIRDFWIRRDPLPDTPENELEREFWRRVSVADRNFGQDIKPGWKTERGKVFIMLGPPDNMERDRLLEDKWRVNRWTYDLRDMPPVLRGMLQEVLRLPMDREVVSLQILDDPEGTRVFSGSVTDRSILRPTGTLKLADVLTERFPGSEPLRLMGLMMRIPEAVENDRLRISVSTAFRMVSVSARVDFRPSLDSSDTVVAVTLGVNDSDLIALGVHDMEPANVILSGYLSGARDGRRVFPLTGRFLPDPSPDAETVEGRTHVFQSIAQVPAGRYLLHAAYRDTEARVLGAVRDYIDVPTYAEEGLTLSSIVLSSRLDRLQSPETPGKGDRDVPFSVGRYVVVPRTSPVYSQPAHLTIFYQIYDSLLGRDGRPHLDVSYRFFLEDHGDWIPVGASFESRDLNDTAQAWSVPLRGWPPGNYRLEVTVLDRLADRRVTRLARFAIDPGVKTATFHPSPRETDAW